MKMTINVTFRTVQPYPNHIIKNRYQIDLSEIARRLEKKFNSTEGRTEIVVAGINNHIYFDLD